MTRIAAFFLAVCFGALALAPASHAATDKRVALVIGNSAYQNTTPLKNPVNDARDLAIALRRLGFSVIEGLDLDQNGMRDKIRAFSTAIEGASVALFYYAGHGMQVAGNNHLAPVNARLEKENDLDFETIPLNLVLRQMERERRTNLVFLDACRDNPLARQLARSLSATRSGTVASGLARVESGIGMMIGYSTSPDNVALDGEGRNSPYTKALLKHVEKPGLDIGSMMIAVRQDVLAESKGKQVPWEHSSLTGQFYFKPEPAKVAAATPAPAPSTEQSAASREDSAVVTAYQATVAIGTCGAYRLFEEQHRGTFYGRLAEEFLRTNCDSARAIAVEKADAQPAKPAPAAPVIAAPAAPAAPAPGPVAALDPAKSPVPAVPATPVSPVLDGPQLTAAVQLHLDRLGCEPGPVDGQWGTKSREALERFSRIAKADIDTAAPTLEALNALESKTARVCPAEPKETPAVVGKPPAAKPAPVAVEKPPVVKREAAPARRPPLRKGEGGVCFNARGQIVGCDSADVHISTRPR